MWRSTAVGVVLPLHCLMETSREKIINSVPKTRKKEWNWSVLFLSGFDTINLKKKQLHLSQLSVNYQGENTIKIYCSRQLPFSPLQEALVQSPVPDPRSIGETESCHWLEFLTISLIGNWLSQGYISHLQPPSLPSLRQRLKLKLCGTASQGVSREAMVKIQKGRQHCDLQVMPEDTQESTQCRTDAAVNNSAVRTSELYTRGFSLKIVWLSLLLLHTIQPLYCIRRLSISILIMLIIIIIVIIANKPVN